MSKQMIFGKPTLITFYLSAIELVLIFVLLQLLCREMAHAKYRVWLEWSSMVLLIFGCAGIFAITVQPALADPYFSLFWLLAGVSIILIFLCTILSLREQRNPELMLFSFGVLTVLLLEIALPVTKLLGWGIVSEIIKIVRPFAMLIPGALILSGRYRQAERQTKEYAASLQELSKKLEEDNRLLEQRVSERTEELEQAHRKLMESMRESAVAMAEVAALEERNRIAQEIHDIVGHTLTTTIVQIEAGKRMIAINPDQAVERMDTSQRLVRKGLDEIRASVRLLRDAEWNYDLAHSLYNVVQETRSHAKVKIDCEIAGLPELSMLQKNTIYMALKEGITNGIKHGHCSRFLFELKESGSGLLFRLKNNGRPIQVGEDGFGLRAMRRQVEQLKGTLSLGGEPEWSCILEIWLPLEADSATGTYP
jgi:signal transduction histidine kinase